jgi:hypothetical protein
MSQIHHSHQCNDAFSPTRLGNWESNARTGSQRPVLPPRRKDQKIEILCDDKGHLLPHVRKIKNSFPAPEQVCLWSSSPECPLS